MWSFDLKRRGRHAEVGQRLAVVEAMTMEQPLTAPFAAVVRNVVAIG